MGLFLVLAWAVETVLIIGATCSATPGADSDHHVGAS